MTKLIAFITFAIAGALGWWLSDNLSGDAIGMALGVLFGALAGIPAAVLVAGRPARSAPRGFPATETPAPNYHVVVVTDPAQAKMIAARLNAGLIDAKEVQSEI